MEEIDYQFSNYSYTDYQNPKNVHSGNGLLWILIKAWKLNGQYILARSGLQKGDTPEYTFKFIAPDEIMENIGHEWGAYESLASRISQKGADLGRLAVEVEALKGVGDAAWSTLKELMGGGKSSITALKGGIAKELGGVGVAYERVDTPLVYQSSQRRKYHFTVYLVDEQKEVKKAGTEPYTPNSYTDIVFIVRELEKLSTPEQDGSFSSIIPPYIFSIQTTHGENVSMNDIPFINVENAALTSIQPIYKGPYRKGQPAHCDLTLEFEEIPPLYRNIFDEWKGKITTNKE